MNFNLFTRQCVGVFALCCAFLASMGLHAQERVAPVTPVYSSINRVPVNLFTVAPDRADYSGIVHDATSLTLDMSALPALVQQHPRYITMQIPQKKGNKTMVLVLERNDILTSDFKVTAPGSDQVLPYTPGIFYKGTVAGHKTNTYVSISIFDNMVMGLISVDGSNYVLGHTGDRARLGSDYVFYNDKDLKQVMPYNCATDDFSVDAPHDDEPVAENMSPSCHTVRFYVEADWALSQYNGSNYTNTVNYVTGLFANMNALYAGISVQAQLAHVSAWYTGDDPYNDASTGPQLDQFAANVAGYAVATDNLRCLWTGDPTGGLAYGFNGLCSDIANSCSTSGGLGYYPAFPNYSWETMVVTHEAGHTLSSRHTHACVWNGNNTAIDNCGPTAGYGYEGSCSGAPTPVGGGTIMSYCHLTGGINFSNGFGSQPGAKIYNYVNGASCLSCPGSGVLNCAGAIPISCGSSFSGQSNLGYPINVNGYSIVAWNETGPEVVYVLTTTQFNPSITVSLSGMTDDLDVFILNACGSANAIAYGDNNATISNVAPGTYYIVVDGYNGAVSTFGINVACTGFCEVVGNTADEYIQEFQVGNFDNVSGNNGGYGDYTYNLVQLQKGVPATGTMVPGYTSTAWSEVFYIYVDYNQDNDFLDDGELVYQSAPLTAASSYSFTPPANIGTITTRMRVVMRYSSYGPTSCGALTYGEVEDYTVQFVPFCASEGNTAFEYIESISVGTVYNESGSNNGYGDYTSLPAQGFELGDAFPVNIIYAGGYNEYAAIYLDLNHDLQFTANEVVYTNYGLTPALGTMTVPLNCQLGLTAMRVVLRFGTAPDGCINDYFEGETEDYYINVYPYCLAQGSTTYEYIEAAQIGAAFNSVTGNNEGSFDNTGAGSSATFLQGEVYQVALTPGFTSSAWDEYWTIFVDKNQDYDFGADEVIFQGNGYGIVNGGLVMPNIAPGNYAMRISMKFGSAIVGCPDYSFSGESETYLITIAANCSNPSPLSVSVQSPTTAAAYWAHSPGATKYNINYRKVGVTAFTSKTVTTNFADLTGLIANSTYEIKIRAYCGSAFLPFGAVQTFSTTMTAACGKPINNGSTHVSPTTEKLYWNAVTGAVKYQVRLRKADLSTPFVNYTALAPFKNHAGLTPNTTYIWQVRVQCTASPITYSAYSSQKTFTTPPVTYVGGSGSGIIAMMGSENNDEEIPQLVGEQLSLSPNPATNVIRLALNGQVPTEGGMFSLDGQRIRNLSAEDMQSDIDVSTLPSGMYLLHITTEDGTQHNLKFVKVAK